LQIFSSLRRKKSRKVGEGENGSYEDKSGLSDIKYGLINVEKHLLWTKLMIDIRFHVFKKSLVHFTNYKVKDVWVESHIEQETKSVESETFEPCVPSYHKFDNMTVNHTTAGDIRYEKTYLSFADAVQSCNKMSIDCQSIIEDRNGVFTLRPTAYLHENRLRYKMGIIEQTDVVETHSTKATHVKVCNHDPRYIQFTIDPLILPGNGRRAFSPKFQINLTISMLHSKNISYTYQVCVMTAHKAIMESKIAAKVGSRASWDSLGQLQFGQMKLLDFSKINEISKYKIKNDKKRAIEVYQVNSGLVSFDPFPGCYIFKHYIINDLTEEPVYEWKTWIQLRAQSKEAEKQFLLQQFRNSINTGEGFRKVQQRNKVVAAQWVHDRKGYRPTSYQSLKKS